MDWDSQVYLSRDQRTFSQISLRELMRQLDAEEIERDTLLCRSNSEGWLPLQNGLSAIRGDFPDFPDYPLIGWTPPPAPPRVQTAPPREVVEPRAVYDEVSEEEDTVVETPNRALGCLSVVQSAIGIAGAIASFVVGSAIVLAVLGMFLAEANPTPEQHLEAIVLEVVPHDMPILPYVSEQWAMIYLGILGPNLDYEDYGVASTTEIRAPNGELLVSTTGFLGNVEVTIHGKGKVAGRLVGKHR